METKRTLRQILNEKKREWIGRTNEPDQDIQKKATAIIESRARLKKQVRTTWSKEERACLERRISALERELEELKNRYTRTDSINVSENHSYIRR